MNLNEQITKPQSFEIELPATVFRIAEIEASAPEGIVDDLTLVAKQEMAAHREKAKMLMGSLLEFRANLKVVIERMKDDRRKAMEIEQQVEAVYERISQIGVHAVGQIGKMKVGDASVSVRTTEKLEKGDEGLIDNRYREQKWVVAPALVKKALKEGKKVGEAKLVKNKHLNVR